MTNFLRIEPNEMAKATNVDARLGLIRGGNFNHRVEATRASPANLSLALDGSPPHTVNGVPDKCAP